MLIVLCSMCMVCFVGWKAFLYTCVIYLLTFSSPSIVDKVNDDCSILDESIADQVSIWKRKKGFSDKIVTDHTCSGDVCSYFQIGDAFICEKTGNVHGNTFL